MKTIGIDLGCEGHTAVTVMDGSEILESFIIGGSIEEALSYLAERFAARTDIVPVNENVRVLEPGWKYSDLFADGDNVVYQEPENEP